MRVLGWNCRGICNASTVRALRILIRGQHLDFLFLSETKASVERLKKLAVSICFSEHVIVGAKGKAGGICLYWSSTFSVEVREFNSKTIAIFVNDGYCRWSLVGFYGPPYKAKRRKAWENLHALLHTLDEPWLCFGNFNVIIDDSEKLGGRLGSSSAPNFLRELLFDLGAVDLGFSGNKFTWRNNRWGKGSICERLDRAIASMNWRTTFPKATVMHLGAINSDHAPLLIDTNPREEFLPRPFRFEAMWTRDHCCSEVIKEAWKTKVFGSPCFKLARKQEVTSVALRKWNKHEFGLCHTRIRELSNNIEAIQRKKKTEGNG
jgi:exonuclease III